MNAKRRIRKGAPRAEASGGPLHRRRRARHLALKALYWLAVLVVSLVIVFLLVLLFESLDDSSVDQGSGVVLPLPGL